MLEGMREVIEISMLPQNDSMVQMLTFNTVGWKRLKVVQQRCYGDGFQYRRCLTGRLGLLNLEKECFKCCV